VGAYGARQVIEGCQGERVGLAESVAAAGVVGGEEGLGLRQLGGGDGGQRVGKQLGLKGERGGIDAARDPVAV
jgi:hypothetical protein